MTMKMNRRTFLKTTAAAALAVSLSGVLTACGGGSTPPSTTAIALGDFTVNITMVKVNKNETVGAAEYRANMIPAVTVRYNGSGFTACQFKDVFSASVNNLPLKLSNGSEWIAKADILGGRSKTYEPSFQVSDPLYDTFQQGGTPLKIRITLQGQTAEYTVTNTGAISVRRVSE